jgi:starch synthase (maltosyl-transferring)
VFRHWIDQGVTIFRVDNPHTKPFAFWEWVIGEIHADRPDVIFLSEAFTRPRVMERLAKVGFSQSYTYFAWRQSGPELRAYFTDLATRTVDYLRPNAWPNTPDILTEQLQLGGRPAFVSRAVLAATLSPSWGVYGPAYELVEHRAVREEYADSEKYQLRDWDLGASHSLAPLLGRLNAIRRRHPALHHLRGLRFHETDNAELLCYSKLDPAGKDAMLIIVNVDPYHAQAGWVDVDLAALGLPYGSTYELHDELGDGTYRWQGNANWVRLDPQGLPAHVFHILFAEVNSSP